MAPLPDTGRAVKPPPAARTNFRRAWDWWAARPALAAAVIYAVLSLIFIGQGLLPGRTLSTSDYLWNAAPWTNSRPADVGTLGSNFEPADAVVVFHPFFEYMRDAFPDLPLWDPYIMAGRPFLANSQSAVLSPFTAPVYVLSLTKALGVAALLKLWVAAFGTFLFARAMGLRFGGSLLAGVVFAFGTFFVVWIPWPLTNIFALLPWLLLASELVVRRPTLLNGSALSALVALQFFGGHPETSFHTMIVVGAFFVFRLVQRARAGDARPELTQRVLAFAGAAVLGTAIAAITLLPLLELLVRSADYERRATQGATHISVRFIGALFLPDYWGRPTQTIMVPFISNRGWYAGGITLMLAVVGLVLRPAAIRLAFAAFALLAFAVATGIEPIFGLITTLPGFAAAHNGRVVIFVLFALAMLAGWGLDELSGRAAWPRRRVALAAAAAIFCVPFVWMIVAGTLDLGQLKGALNLAWRFTDEAATDPRLPVSDVVTATVRLSSLMQWLPLAGLGLALIAIRLLDIRLRSLALPVAAFVALVVAVAVADLFRANMGFNTAIPIDNAKQPKTDAIRYLESRRPNRFAGLNTPRNIHPLPPDLAIRYHLYDARGYDYPVDKRFDAFWRATAAPPESFNIPSAEALPTAKALRGMSLLSVSDVMQDPSDPPAQLPGLRLAYDGPDARVYRNVNALPRTFLVDSQQVADGEDAALATVVDSGFDARRVAVTERRVPGIGTGAGGDAGSARFEHYGPERVVVRADARRRSLLVLTDSWFPGWKAKVDGRTVDVERVDYLLRGVAVPAGSHEVEFFYEPASWRIGWIVSALGLMVLLALVALGWRRREARQAP
jgi:Bacterial membrane protein YfhO